MTIVDRELEAEQPREEYDASYANSAWVIAACARCIAERPTKEWADTVHLSNWTSRVVEKGGWSGQALDGIAALVRSRYGDVYPIFVFERLFTSPFSCATQNALGMDSVYEQLKSALLSH